MCFLCTAFLSRSFAFRQVLPFHLLVSVYYCCALFAGIIYTRFAYMAGGDTTEVIPLPTSLRGSLPSGVKIHRNMVMLEFQLHDLRGPSIAPSALIHADNWLQWREPEIGGT